MCHSQICCVNAESLEMGFSFLFESWFRVFIRCSLFEQCMLKIKVLTFIFSFDYKHMSGAPRSTSGWDTDNVFQAWAQFTLHSGNDFELSGLGFRFLFKISFQKHKKHVQIIKNPSLCKKLKKGILIEYYKWSAIFHLFCANTKIFWKHMVSCYLPSVYQAKRHKERNNKKRREGEREILLGVFNRRL